MRADPVWFPVGVTQQGVEWAQTSRNTLSEAPFLFPDVFSGAKKQVRPSEHTDGILPRYIFHTAFCCSTLFARALDRAGKVLSLKEPEILMQLANFERNQPGKIGPALSSITGGLFADDLEVRIIKPTNAANRIISELMQFESARAIIIHSDFESFVLSIARKGEEGRTFVRRLYNILLMDSPFAQSLPQRDVFTLSDLQIAGFVWAIQCQQVQDAVNRFPDRYRMVHCDDFLGKPSVTLAAVAEFLSLPLTSEDIDEAVASDVFGTNSKFADQSFDTNIREAQKLEAQKAFAQSIEFVRNWVGKLPLPLEIRGRALLNA